MKCAILLIIEKTGESCYYEEKFQAKLIKRKNFLFKIQYLIKKRTSSRSFDDFRYLVLYDYVFYFILMLNKTVSSILPSIRLTFSAVAIIIFTSKLFCSLRL